MASRRLSYSPMSLADSYSLAADSYSFDQSEHVHVPLSTPSNHSFSSMSPLHLSGVSDTSVGAAINNPQNTAIQNPWIAQQVSQLLQWTLALHHHVSPGAPIPTVPAESYPAPMTASPLATPLSPAAQLPSPAAAAVASKSSAPMTRQDSNKQLTCAVSLIFYLYIRAETWQLVIALSVIRDTNRNLFNTSWMVILINYNMVHSIKIVMITGLLMFLMAT